MFSFSIHIWRNILCVGVCFQKAQSISAFQISTNRKSITNLVSTAVLAYSRNAQGIRS